MQLRSILDCLDVFVVPQPQICLSFAGEAFYPDGSLKDKKIEERLRRLVRSTLAAASGSKRQAELAAARA